MSRPAAAGDSIGGLARRLRGRECPGTGPLRLHGYAAVRWNEC